MPVQLIIRNPLDRDAREYIQRAGVTDAAARLQLNEFVRGVKQLGLWESMVCWPLQEAQNSGGTSTTAYSLGGLGTYNGTLTNGPTWGAAGVAFDGSDDLVSVGDDASFRVGDSGFTVAAWVNPDVVNGIQRGIISKESATGGPGQREYMLVVHSSNTFRFYVRSGTTGDYHVGGATAVAGQNQLAVAWHDSTADTLNIQINNAAPISISYALGIFSSTNPLQIGVQGTSTYFDGLVSFAAVFRRVLSAAERSFLYNSGTPLI